MLVRRLLGVEMSKIQLAPKLQEPFSRNVKHSPGEFPRGEVDRGRFMPRAVPFVANGRARAAVTPPPSPLI